MLVGFQNYTLLAGASAVVYNIIIGTTAFLSKYLQRNIITVATLYYIISYTILYAVISIITGLRQKTAILNKY